MKVTGCVVSDLPKSCRVRINILISDSSDKSLELMHTNFWTTPPFVRRDIFCPSTEKSGFVTGFRPLPWESHPRFSPNIGSAPPLVTTKFTSLYTTRIARLCEAEKKFEYKSFRIWVMTSYFKHFYFSILGDLFFFV